MTPKTTGKKAMGWEVCESILMELDIFINILSGYFSPVFFDDIDKQKLTNIPKDLLTDFNKLMPRSDRLIFVLSRMALPLGLMVGTDYKEISLRFRKTTPEKLMASHTGLFGQTGITPNASLDMAHRLADLLFRGEKLTSELLGLRPDESFLKKTIRLDVQMALKIIKGGAMEYEFWHWMDRFHYEFYLPWRASQLHIIGEQQKEAINHLGGKSSSTGFPTLSWLKGRQPLTERDSVIQGLQRAGARMYLVATPFKYIDLFHFIPGHCLLTLARSAFVQDEIKGNISRIATAARAVSDPTRLSILRSIRHNGMYTTELATLMNLSRPTVSEHCKILRNADLIETYPEGRKSFHRLRPENVRNLFTDLENFLDLPF
ncbi:MAG: winged helix-turn-helix transcriptional regulator [Desulfobacteraceae bacterium]|nr:winged helix-turn-helix transcriptional regulator [Desulfobacteraceae bacterium]